MSNLTVKLKYQGKFFKKKAVPEFIIKPAVKTTLKQAKQDLIKVTPVDTGLAKRSWHYRSTSPISGKVYNSTDYIHFVDEGTARIRPRRFTAKVRESLQKRLKDNIADEIIKF